MVILAGAGSAGRQHAPQGDVALVIEIGCLAVGSRIVGRRLPLAEPPSAQRIHEPSDRVSDCGHGWCSSQVGCGPQIGWFGCSYKGCFFSQHMSRTIASHARLAAGESMAGFDHAAAAPRRNRVRPEPLRECRQKRGVEQRQGGDVTVRPDRLQHPRTQVRGNARAYVQQIEPAGRASLEPPP